MKVDTVDMDACAALTRRLREEGTEATMHTDYLRSEAQERALGPTRRRTMCGAGDYDVITETAGSDGLTQERAEAAELSPLPEE
ncbi:hypothetical protein [Streptomyces fumanus]|uniref:hypothetical protein n=1 Tax=Streptomyces fumanus TaxID=67302 RepID=UPI00167C571B|nr:hypothetical protein [Streptomyces fumanus]